MKKIKIIKNRSDIGAGTRGSDMGIDAIEIAAINARNKFFTEHPYVDLETHNESVYNKVNFFVARRIEFVLEQCERVAAAVKESLAEGNFTIVLSGDHSSALGAISGVKASNPSNRLGVVWIDAHSDMHSPYTTPSGNVHGMPLAAAMGEDNIENGINQLSEQSLQMWTRWKGVGTEGPKVNHGDVVFFGLRSTEIQEDKLREKYNMRNFRVDEVRFRGADACLEETRQILGDCDSIYISFDVDSLDPDFISRGTGTPVPKGFDADEVTVLIKGMLSTGKVVCLEIAEVNPLLDTKGNKMAETAFQILDDVTKYYLGL